MWSWKSHGKKQKYQKSWKYTNFTLIRFQNRAEDMVVFKIVLLLISLEKLAGIPTAEMVMESRKFSLICSLNIVMDIVVSEIV